MDCPWAIFEQFNDCGLTREYHVQQQEHMMDDAWWDSMPWTWSHRDQLCASTSMWLWNVINWSQTGFGLCDLWGVVRKSKSLYLEGKHKVSRAMRGAKVHCGSGTVKIVMEWQKDDHGTSLSRKIFKEILICFMVHPQAADKI